MPTLFKPSPGNLWAALVVREPTAYRSRDRTLGEGRIDAIPEAAPRSRRCPRTRSPSADGTHSRLHRAKLEGWDCPK